VTTSTQHRGT